MAFALEERDLEEPLCVDLEQVERREDLTAAELSRIGIAGVIEIIGRDLPSTTSPVAEASRQRNSTGQAAPVRPQKIAGVGISAYRL